MLGVFCPLSHFRGCPRELSSRLHTHLIFKAHYPMYPGNCMLLRVLGRGSSSVKGKLQFPVFGWRKCALSRLVLYIARKSFHFISPTLWHPHTDVDLPSFREKLLLLQQGSAPQQRRASLQEAKDACYLQKEGCTGLLRLSGAYYLVAGTVLVDSPGSDAVLYVKAGEWLLLLHSRCRRTGRRLGRGNSSGLVDRGLEHLPPSISGMPLNTAQPSKVL